MYTHNTHYIPDHQWFDGYPDQNELDDMFFYNRSEKNISPRLQQQQHQHQHQHYPQHFYNPEDRFFDDDEESYRRSFHRECYCDNCGHDVRHKKKKKGLRRRQTIGDLKDISTENTWRGNLRQKSVYAPPNLHDPVIDPMMMGPPCTTGAQDNSGWFPMMNAMPPPIPNTNSFMMPTNPMMQPYFLPMPIPDFSNMTYPFHQPQPQQQQGFLFPESRPNSAPEGLPPSTEETDKPKLPNNTNASLSHDINTLAKKADTTDPTTSTTQHTKGHTDTFPLRKTPVLAQRRKSLVEELISSFSIFGPSVKKEPMYGTKWDPSSFTSLNDAFGSGNDMGKSSKSVSSPPQQQQQQQQHQNSSTSSSSSTSSAAAVAPITPTMTVSPKQTLSRKVSHKLTEKANILSQRPFVWCYRPFQEGGGQETSSLWAAFDVPNQIKLDSHFQTVLAKRPPGSRVGGEDTITKDDTTTLYKQSQLPGRTIVATHHGMAWHCMNGSTRMLEIARIPSDHNRFVVANDLVQEDNRLHRSKSLDKLASRLFNTVLGK